MQTQWLVHDPNHMVWSYAVPHGNEDIPKRRRLCQATQDVLKAVVHQIGSDTMSSVHHLKH